MPYTWLGSVFGLVPLPWIFMLTLAVITLLYLMASECLKQVMFAQLEERRSTPS